MSTIVNNLRLTGVPSQALLCGAPGQKQTQGCVMHITYQSEGFPVTLDPEILDRLHPHDTILDSLEMPPFKGLTNSQKLQYIKSRFNPEAQDSYISDPQFGPAWVVFESLGTGKNNMFLKLSLEDQNILLRGCDLHQVYLMINRDRVNPNNPNKRHNMVFRPANWTLTFKLELPRSSYTLVDLDDLTIDLLSGFDKEFLATEYLVLGKPLGIVYTPGDHMKEASLPSGCEWYGHGVMKSCLQKIIRYSPRRVTTFKTTLEVDEFLESMSRHLCVHGDGFIPDLQIHVKGYEGYFKRLAVSIVEDAYTSQVMNLLVMLAAALAARGSWIPSEAFFVKTQAWAREAIQDRRYYDYNSHDEGLDQLDLTTLETPWRGVVEMIDHLKSFKSDLLMFRSIAKRSGTYRRGLAERPDVMLESRSIDHHSVTEIAHLLWSDLSFQQRFHTMWQKSSGVNWRKNNRPDDSMCVFAQQAYSYHAQGDETFEVSLVEAGFKCQVETCWISYMIGVFTQGAILSFCDPEDPYVFRSIRRPSRDKKPPLSLEAIEASNARFEEYLKRGVEAKNPFTKAVERIVLTCEGFRISGQTIADWCQQTSKINLGPYIPSPEWYTCLTTPRPQCSMVANWQAILMEKVKALSSAGHQRLVQMFQPVQDVYEVPRIARDGGSADLTVKLEDTEVIKVWMVLHYILPGVFTLKSNFKLQVTWRLGFLAVRDTIMTTRVSNTMYTLEMPWTYPCHFNEQQSEALEELESRRASGLRGNLIWMSTGTGKTALALKWLHNAMIQGWFPGYAIFTYPKSSESNLKSELARSGLAHTFISGQKGREVVLPQGQVICIHHDDLRRCEKELMAVADRALVVIDEVHLFMNETQRTSMGLLLATLSVDFVGMTGTLIYDKEVQKILRWLKQIVRFPVTPQNFYIAISSICSHLTEVPVKVEDTDQRYELPDTLKSRYLKLVPASMGGTALQIDFRAAAEMCYQYVEQLLYQEVMACKKDIPQDDVFVIVRDTATAERLQTAFVNAGLKTFAFTRGATLTYTPESVEKYDVVIAPYRQTTGYTLTGTNRTFTSIYFTNTAARQQIKARNIRIGQTKDVYYKVIHCGILSYVKDHYETANSLVKSLTDLAKLHQV